MSNKELKIKAKKQIAPYMKTLILISFLFFVFTVINRYLKIPYGKYLSTIFELEYSANDSIALGSFLIIPVFNFSNVIIYLNITRGIAPKIKDLFVGFKDWWSIVKLNFVSGFFVTCWCFLFIIPGIVKSYSYSMATYILAENKGMRSCEAISRSRAMMTGHKMELFKLDLSLICYSLLTLITFGIASIWVQPYLCSVRANFYRKLKGNIHIPIYDN